MIFCVRIFFLLSATSEVMADLVEYFFQRYEAECLLWRGGNTMLLRCPSLSLNFSTHILSTASSMASKTSGAGSPALELF